MKKRGAIIISAMLICSSLGGCALEESSTTTTTQAQTSDNDSTDSTTDTDSVTVIADASEADEEMFTNRDSRTEYDESDAVQIVLDGDSATATSETVIIDGSTVTITAEATYILSGTLDDGMVIVDAPDDAKIQLVLDGVTINSESSAAIYILEADKVFITLAEGSENYLSNGGTFTAIDDNNIDGAIYSKQDLTLNGYGSLTVTSPAGHGIVGKDDLVITSGTYIITSASHGLQANDSIRITGDTSISVDAGKDGLHAENDDDSSLGFVYISGGTFDIEAEGDGISAGAYMQIYGGVFELLTGGGYENAEEESSDSWGGFMGGGGRSESSSSSSSTSSDDDSSTSMKGLKAAGDMYIYAGSFLIDSADDAVHSNSSITVSGGSFEIATGDDGFHADDTLTITDGAIDITTSYEGLEALNLCIEGGDISIVATDDGLNAAGGTDSSGTTGGRDGMFGGGWGDSSSSNGTMVISGGTLYINASGDGMDANGTIEISGGYITVVGPTQGDTSTLDYDVSAVITGGTFIGTGASSMAETFSDSEQGVIAVSVGTQSAGTLITVTDSDGNVVLEYEPELSYQVFIFSSPELVSGDTYTISVGTISGDVSAS